MIGFLTKFISLILMLSICLTSSVDISTYANLDQVKQSAIAFDVNINFDKRIIEGLVRITFNAITDGNIIVLDTMNLTINSIVDSKRGDSLKWVMDSQTYNGALGCPLNITLNNPYSAGDKVEILINYATSDQSLATQWYSKEMTLGKEYPFMYTQGEAILGRSLIPCQDTPAAKVTINASLRVQKPLVALYSGIKTGVIESDDSLTYVYQQKIPVATYLIAISAGAIESRVITDRTTVYAEKEIVDNAAWEFAETEKFIEVAEAYLTPYEWGQYNILVLPPGFPYGGMENPCLTFVTPALIAGDRSLANVIAHEISHSWTGNLVTNRNWQSFWLNEGFTVFVERKISEIVYGDDMKKLSAAVGYNDLVADIKNFGETDSFTSLHPDIQQKNPDDAFSSVPYEKGFNFLYYLESLTGKDKFKAILKAYISKFRLQSLEYTDWINHFTTEVNSLFDKESAQSLLAKVDWDTWIFKPGFPIVQNDFDNVYSTEAKSRLNDVLNNQIKDDFPDVFKNWHTNVKLVFLNMIADNLSTFSEDSYAYFRDTLKINTDYNMEIKNVWFQIALNSNHKDVIPYATDFLGKIGRMKYIRPIYKAFAHVDRDQAYSVFTKFKIIYHPAAVRLIEADFQKQVQMNSDFLGINMGKLSFLE